MKSSPAPSRSSPTKAQPERSRSLSPQKSSMKQPFRAASAPIPNVGAKMKRSERVPPPLPERKRVASPEKVARLAQEEFIKRQEASRQALSHPDIYYDALSEFRKLYPTFFSRDDYAGGVLTPPPHDPEYQSGGQASNPFEDGRWRRARRAGTQSPTLAEEMRMKKQSDGGSYWSGGFSVTPRLTMKRDAWVGDDNDDERLQYGQCSARGNHESICPYSRPRGTPTTTAAIAFTKEHQKLASKAGPLGCLVTRERGCSCN
ncbi:hypothetical protein DFS34DRAFT_501099 [Phlyctochytrium arcticum]|nr:hypothetical protein DFS34DRAFT_501099 [Phlyctochytrium arcticum]